MLIKGDDIKLFLTDLCGRICYRPKGVLLRTGFDDEKIEVIGYDGHFIDFFRKGDYDQASIDLVRLYLRPMSSMTEEEEGMYNLLQGISHLEEQHWTAKDGKIYRYSDAIDWLNENHFDYRGLIEKGLALEAPADMYKTH